MDQTFMIILLIMIVVGLYMMQNKFNKTGKKQNNKRRDEYTETPEGYETETEIDDISIGTMSLGSLSFDSSNSSMSEDILSGDDGDNSDDSEIYD